MTSKQKKLIILAVVIYMLVGSYLIGYCGRFMLKEDKLFERWRFGLVANLFIVGAYAACKVIYILLKDWLDESDR